MGGCEVAEEDAVGIGGDWAGVAVGEWVSGGAGHVRRGPLRYRVSSNRSRCDDRLPPSSVAYCTNPLRVRKMHRRRIHLLSAYLDGIR